MTLFPTDAQYGAIQRKYPAPELDLIDKSALDQFGSSALSPFAEITIQEWWIHLSNRMIHARQAYHLMLYFFELGIPDDRPFISPGRDGSSVEYFPDFGDDDYSTKAWFDFYGDVFGYKLFSAWDSVGQLLAEAYGLKLKRPNFHSAGLGLQKRVVPLGDALLGLWHRTDFEHFRALRHEATHGFLPGTFGGSITQDTEPQEIQLMDGQRVTSLGSFSIGVGKYVRSRERVAISKSGLAAFNDTLKACGLRGA